MEEALEHMVDRVQNDDLSLDCHINSDTTGLSDRLSVADFLGLRFLVGAGLALAIISFIIITNRPFDAGFRFSLAGFLIGLYTPNIWLRNKGQNRQHEVTIALPDALDMMSICVEAGLTFEASIQKSHIIGKPSFLWNFAVLFMN